MGQSPTTTRSRSPLTWFGDRRVGTRILTAVGLAVAAGATVGAIGVAGLARTDSAAQQMVQDNVYGYQQAVVMRRATLEMRVAVTNQALSADESEIADYTAAARQMEADIRDALEEYRTVATGDEAKALDEFAAALDTYVQIRDTRLLPAGATNDLAAWRDARDDATAPITAMMGSLETLVDTEITGIEAAAGGVRQTYLSSRTSVVVLLAVGIALSVLLGLYVTRSIVGGLHRVRAVADALQRKDLTVTAGLVTADEMGRTGDALDSAVGTLRGLVSTIDSSALSLAGAAEQMAATSQQIASSAEETSAQAGVVSAAAEQVSRSVETVAAGAEQMGASIAEIAQNAQRAAQVARTAVTEAATTSQTVGRLGDSSREIGNVVNLITSIAGQTNLLALNATIEAARAGAAGKGFAVVAGEVKDLAQETARATEDIARRVEAIQADTQGAVAAIGRITEVITSIDDFQTTIAAAVEEQTSTTSEMSRNVAQAATGSGEIASNISGVADAAELTTRGVGDSTDAVATLARMSSDLRVLVGSFTV